MNRTFLRSRNLLTSSTLAATLLSTAAGQSVPTTTSEPVTELERFIANESALSDSGDVLPTSRPVFSVFGSQSILDVPRSVTVLTPELMSQIGIQDFSDLAKIGAGTQQTNYYGVPGSPSLRGAKGGVYFNGIQRAWQRNEMPLSFGSLEAMDVVKGPAPAHYGASQVGGYTNLIPKSPYFDKKRGSVNVEVGDYNHYRVQADVGGPTLLFGKPAAYRISLTGQLADSYYDRIGNDFISLYGAVKSRVAKDVTLFTGGEYFNFKSNENAGWNRPTQNLINNGQYVIGEPLSIVSSAWNGVANRGAIYSSTALVVPASVVDAAVSSNFITATQRSAMLNLANPTQRATAYSGFSAATLSDMAQSTSGYLYTPAYFTAGGKVFTTKIDGSTVLSDSSDYADSENLLYFFDAESNRNANVALKGSFLLDYISTDKLSTYGYAISTDQLVLEAKGTATEAFDVLAGMNLTYGLSARYTDAYMLQDFFDEPFSRRDISSGVISANSVILTGPQRGPDGKNFWSPTAQGGANADSKLWQFSAFGYATNKITSALTTYTSLLLAHAPYETSYPSEVDLVPASDPRRQKVSDKKNYYSVSFSPVLTVAPGVNLFATAQRGTALDPLQGGAIVGKGNFSKNELYEAGVKTALIRDSLFASVSAYKWEQTAFDERSNNAEPLEGRGVEVEFTYAPNKNFSLIGSYNNQIVERKSPLGFRTVPLTEQQWALNAGILPNNFSGIPPQAGYGPYDMPARNPDMEYPGTPQQQIKLFAIYSFDNGFGISGGPVWSDSYWHNFDHSLKIDSSVVINASLFYRKPTWEITLAMENVTDEDYFLGADPVFAANTLITKAPGFNGKLSYTYKF